ncbi:MAG: c-type cytochrome [bacterium]|jgi:mono/diheme cytochrome c family protein
MKYIRLSVLLLIPLMLMACNRGKNNPGYDYMGSHDMYYTKFYKAYSPNPILSDSMTNQLPPEGAISRGNMPYPYPGGTIQERAANQVRAGLEVQNPVASSPGVIARGKQQYDIFCINCHGKQGKGDGYLHTSGLFPAKPTSLVEARVKGMPDGEVFYVITMGSMSGLMGPHGGMIQPDDRWAIIHYIRELGK